LTKEELIDESVAGYTIKGKTANEVVFASDDWPSDVLRRIQGKLKTSDWIYALVFRGDGDLVVRSNKLNTPERGSILKTGELLGLAGAVGAARRILKRKSEHC
jgi:hypothetical protein